MTFKGPGPSCSSTFTRTARFTDLTVAGPSNIDAFNRAAHNAILQSNPTEPLPPEYPEPVAVLHGHVLLQRTAAPAVNDRAVTTRGGDATTGAIIVLAALLRSVFIRVL
jgi:hypothetical protein